jgi:plasmid stability protein
METRMADLTVRGIPEEVYEALKAEAEGNRRSLNQEIVHRLERSVRVPRADPTADLERIRSLRRDLSHLEPLDDATLERARRGGRP